MQFFDSVTKYFHYKPCTRNTELKRIKAGSNIGFTCPRHHQPLGDLRMKTPCGKKAKTKFNVSFTSRGLHRGDGWAMESNRGPTEPEPSTLPMRYSASPLLMCWWRGTLTNVSRVQPVYNSVTFKHQNHTDNVQAMQQLKYDTFK